LLLALPLADLPSLPSGNLEGSPPQEHFRKPYAEQTLAHDQYECWMYWDLRIQALPVGQCQQHRTQPASYVFNTEAPGLRPSLKTQENHSVQQTIT